MSSTVVLYLFDGVFNGESEVEYSKAPKIGAKHKCILFIRQQNAAPDESNAKCVGKFHGWNISTFSSIRPLDVESLNSNNMRNFQANYIECLEHGDSIVWYP